MPTATKIISAVAFALVGFWAAVSYIPHLPEGTAVGFFREIIAVLGFLVGWRSMGRNSGKGYSESVGYGLRTSFLVVFWALLGFATYTMIQRSFRHMYGSEVGKALLDVPKIMMEYGKLALAQDVLVALIAGGVLAGIVAEFVARRWT